MNEKQQDFQQPRCAGSHGRSQVGQGLEMCTAGAQVSSEPPSDSRPTTFFESLKDKCDSVS